MALIIKRGSTSKNSFVLTDTNGDPVDMTGATFQLLIKEKYGGVDLYRTTVSDIPNPTEGIVNVVIDQVTTGTFPEGRYPSEVMLLNAGNEKFYSQVIKTRVEPIIDEL
jgi:hypothetical protein